MRDNNIEIGAIYKWKPTGTIVFCINWDLETFTGIILKVGNKDKKALKLGKISNEYNADSEEWKEIKTIKKLKKELHD